MKPKTKLFLAGVVIALLGASFVPLFDDPFHEKAEKVTFWEWIGKEIYEALFGER